MVMGVIGVNAETVMVNVLGYHRFWRFKRLIQV